MLENFTADMHQGCDEDMLQHDSDEASRLISRPIFASLGLEGFRSRCQTYCPETLYT